MKISYSIRKSLLILYKSDFMISKNFIYMKNKGQIWLKFQIFYWCPISPLIILIIFQRNAHIYQPWIILDIGMSLFKKKDWKTNVWSAISHIAWTKAFKYFIFILAMHVNFIITLDLRFSHNFADLFFRKNPKSADRIRTRTIFKCIFATKFAPEIYIFLRDASNSVLPKIKFKLSSTSSEITI